MPEAPAESGYVLAFDFGLRHIGTAVGQTITRSASPLKTLEARNGSPKWSQVRMLIDAWKPVRLLVGLPLNMDGSDGAICAEAREFALELERRFDLPVTLVDERLTTHEALEQTQGDYTTAHNVAAALIAETYLR